MKKIIEGSHAIAEAVKLSMPKVIAAYPITPQTHIIEKLAEMVAGGELDAEYMTVESEHSAMAACIGAQATGVRTFTATCSAGMAYMWELLYCAAGMRLPIVMGVANRALSAPLNIWNDWSDSMGARDSGWIQLYCETAQEAFDTILQAYRIAEHHNVLLPVMVCIDGFWLSHVYEPVNVLEEQDFVKPYQAPEIDVDSDEGFKRIKIVLDPKQPISMGEYATPQYYQEFKEAQQIAMLNAKLAIKEIHDEFAKKYGRSYGNGLIETYNMDNAKYAIVTMGSVCGTIKHLIENEKIKDVGLIRIKSFRPFPTSELQKALERIESFGVFEKVCSPGLGGVVFNEVKAKTNKPGASFIGGLGGRDVTLDNVRKMFDLIRIKDENIHWI
ncbi:MAG: pyruvate ferredoxin oxidoreductase [Candidatus Aenigmarchaeota archaeon]|nr:pyruvate ferredoxin oxidoreductase [Candidatus Aenigmarchaeota archaeon]